MEDFGLGKTLGIPGMAISCGFP